MSSFLFAFTITLGFPSISGKTPDLSKRVVHAVNCGGQQHIGAYGITYQEDQNPVGIVSDYGARYTFPNAPTEDRRLYETERYHNGDLTYVFDIAKDGDYVIVLKFSEVYFGAAGEKVFHVHVNDLPVKRDLDIFREARAAGVAYDLYIDLSIKKKEITIGDLIGDIDRELHIRLIPVLDNPKINAIAVLTGTSATLPPQPPPITAQQWEGALSANVLRECVNFRPISTDTLGAEAMAKRRRSRKKVMESDDEDEEDDGYSHHSEILSKDRGSSEHNIASGPRAPDPFLDKNDNVFVYLAVALVCLLPVIAFLMHM